MLKWFLCGTCFDFHTASACPWVCVPCYPDADGLVMPHGVWQPPFPSPVLAARGCNRRGVHLRRLCGDAVWAPAPPCTWVMLLSALFCVFKIKQAQDEERRQLIQLRDILKSALQVEQKEVRGFNFERLLFLYLCRGGFGTQERDFQHPPGCSQFTLGLYQPPPNF